MVNLPHNSTRGLPLFDFDPCAARHRGATDSVLAQHRTGAAARAEQKARVLAAIESAGETGLTVDELAVAWDTTPNRISGRFSELRFERRILPAGRRATRTGHTATAWKAAS